MPFIATKTNLLRLPKPVWNPLPEPDRHDGKSNPDYVSFCLFLGLCAGNGALFLPRHLGHDLLALVLGHVLDQNFVGLLEIGIGIDALHHAFAHTLLPFKLAHFVQDDGAFEPVAGHGLDVLPILGLLGNPIINFGFHFGIDPVVDGLRGRTGARSAIGRGFRFCCAHNEV